MALLTLEGFSPRVSVVVSISVVFLDKHFGAEIAFKFRWQMNFTMVVKSTPGRKCHWALTTIEGLSARAVGGHVLIYFLFKGKHFSCAAFSFLL